MRRNEIWWANMPAPLRSRPVVLLSRDEAYERRLSVTIAPITTRIRGIPTEIPVGAEEGVPRASVINVDDITTIPLDALEGRMGDLSEEKARDVNRAILFALNISAD
jgi:mRNA interferase MazF